MLDGKSEIRYGTFKEYELADLPVYGLFFIDILEKFLRRNPLLWLFIKSDCY